MTPIFKKKRILIAVTLGISCCGIANAQDASVKDPDVSSTVNQLNRRLYSVKNNGSFTKEYKTILEAAEAAEGSSYNRTLKDGNEIIVMNSRCGTGNLIEPVTFSIYQMDGYTSASEKDLSPSIQSYLENIKNKGSEEVKKLDSEMIDKVMKTLSVSRFPQKNACDPVPVVLSFTNGQLRRLEADDAQNELIGPKYNNGTLYDALSSNEGFMASEISKTRAFWEKYGNNNFSNVQDAAYTAGILAGTKAVIFNGSNFAIYRIDAFKFPNNTDGSKNFDVLKTAPLPKGWKIMVIASGRKFIKIYDPNTK